MSMKEFCHLAGSSHVKRSYGDVIDVTEGQDLIVSKDVATVVK
uniref:Uncharacterized protein n=1 Tax=Bacillus thuringiensis serovar chinensis CT-43 TaxID=541229 RepID=E7CGS4_BACTU|nr:hypothetical protein pBMB0558_00755 [Bacillus thuringiensis serovar chinensis CT-43]